MPSKADILGFETNVVTLIVRRSELLDEVAGADADVRTYIAEEMRRLLAKPRLAAGLAGAMRGDAASQERVDIVVLPAFRTLAESRPE